MRKFAKREIMIDLIILGIIFAFSSILFYNINDNARNGNLGTENLKISTDSEKIHIIGNSGWVAFRNDGNCTGSGTYSDPYVIEDLVIDVGNSGSCIWIENSDVYFKIENCSLYNPGRAVNNSGIKLYNADNGQLINNTLNSENGAFGIFLAYSNNNSIMGNIIDNILWGIRLLNSHNNNISENIQNDGFEGISLEYSDNNNISGNTASSNSIGILLEYSDYIIVSGNVADFNSNYGIRLIGGYKNIISGNNASYNFAAGIRLYYIRNCIISGNTVNYNDYGIEFGWNNDYNNILGNTVNNNSFGIELRNENDNNNILGNTINYNEYGIRLWESNENSISGNIINNNSNYGIYLEKSDNNGIRFNTITNNDIGIYLYKSYSNEISNNTFSGNNVDIKKYFEPEFPFGVVITITLVILIAFAMILTSMIIIKRRASRPRTKVFPFEKYREKLQITEKPIKEIVLEPETKSELKISPEVDKLEVIQEAGIPSTPEEKPEELEVLQEEEVVVSAPEEQPEELEVLQEEEVVSDLEEIPIEEDVLQEEIVVSTSEEQPEELIPPEPQIIKCPFCGKENSEGAIFCNQCGMIFKKK